MGNIVKNYHFEPVFLDYFSNGTLQRAEVFALHSVHHNPSFWLPKSTFRKKFRFFTVRGGGKIDHHRKEKSYRGPREVFGNGMTRGTTWEGVEVLVMI